MRADSIDKCVTAYFRGVAEEPFTYKGITYTPTTLIVSPQLLRSTTCPANCGACCRNYTMDFLPLEKLPTDIYPSLELEKRDVDFNGKKYPIFTIKRDETTHYCNHLDLSNGRCKIHECHSFGCDFFLIAFQHPKLINSPKPSHIRTRLLGRAWAFTRVDGGKGTLCQTTAITDETIKDTVRKLKRLKEWCDYFELKNKVPKILDWIEHGDITKDFKI